MSIVLMKLLLFVIIVFVVVNYFRRDSNRLKNLLKNIKEFLFPKDESLRPENFTKMQLKALADKRTISKLLFYRSYMADEDSDLGFFKMHDGRAGIVFKVEPPIYLTEKIEDVILNILGSVVSDDTIVHISALAGRDISEFLNGFRANRDHEKLNLKYPEKLKEIIDDKIDSFESWTTESIMGKDADLRVRNFTHMISILFPIGLEKVKILKQSNEIYGILKDSMNAVVANDNDLVAFVKEILNPSLKHYPKDDDPVTTISKRMTKNAKVDVDNEEGIIYLKDNWMAKVLTTEKYPKEIDSFGYQNIFFDFLRNDYQIKLPCLFYLSLSVKFTDIEKTRRRVLEKAKWNIGQLAAFQGSTVEKQLPEIKDRRKENEDVVQYLNYLGEQPLDALWSLTVFENDKNRLEQYVSLIKASFNNFPGRWAIKEEQYPNIAFYTLLMGLPLNYSEALHSVLDKSDKNFKSNNAQIAPLVGGFKGMGEKPTHMYIDGTGQITGIDIFASRENYNMVIVGPMGTGKSFFTNNFLMSGLDKGWQIRMIDFGRSYKRAVEIVGGQFLEFTKKADICLNFFTHLQTVKKVIDGYEVEVIDPEEFESIVPIVGLMMGVSLKEIYKNSDSSSTEKLELTVMASFVIEAVNEVFRRHGRSGGMREVGEVLDEMKRKKIEENGGIVNGESEILAKMCTSLTSYTREDGPFFKYFNGANNINLDSSYFVLELDDIATSPMMPVVAMSFLQRTAQEAFIKHQEDMSIARIIGVDEAHKIIGNEIFAKYYDDFGRRIRKYKGIPILVTQGLSDFRVNHPAKMYFELASWKILLKQKPESIDGAIKDKQLILTPFQKDLANSIKLKTPHYNEFLLIHDGIYSALSLKVNGQEYWIYTTRPTDKEKLNSYMKEYNLTLRDAVWVLGKISDGMSKEQAIYEVNRREGVISNVNWDETFKVAIEEQKICIAKQNILYKEDGEEKVEYEELFMRIVSSNGVVFSPNTFMVAAREKGYATEISKLFLDQVYRYISKYDNKNMYFSINVDIDDISDKEYVDYLFLTYKRLKNDKNRLFLEIELDYNVRTNSIRLFNFAKEAKGQGINIAFDNVVLQNVDWETFVNIEPKYLKISVGTIKEVVTKESKLARNFFSSLTSIANMKIIATKIENKEDIQMVEEINIHRFQGYGVDRTREIEC